MKKTQLLALASLTLTAFNALAHNMTSIWEYHDVRFSGKSFRLFQPMRNQCFNFGNRLSNPSTLFATTCSENSADLKNYRLQYVDGSIKTMQSFSESSDGGQKCLTLRINYVLPHFESCDGSTAQQFRIAKFATANPLFSTVEDRFVIQSKLSDKCLYNNGMGTEIRTANCFYVTNTNKANFFFELVDVTEPVHVRLVNRAWFNMSYTTTFDAKKWNPSWLILNGVRERALPTYAHTGIATTPLVIETDYSRSAYFDAEPGDVYEATAHGTTFNRTLKAERVRKIPQVKIYSGYDFSSPKGSRYIPDSVSNLMAFNNNIQSYHIPEGWTVRFYEKPNYQGDYFTRTASSGQDSHIDMNIQSIKIISK